MSNMYQFLSNKNTCRVSVFMEPLFKADNLLGQILKKEAVSILWRTFSLV